MENPQLENGFMRIANEIVDELFKLPLNSTDQKVIWCVLRYTFGFNRKSHRLSASFMTYSRLANKMAGINKRDEATVMQLNNLSLMENIILHEVDLGIMQGKRYQEIYRDCKKRLEAVKDLAYLEAV